jgi:hypothetical protein
MFRILIAVADVECRHWLTQCFRYHPEFSTVNDPVKFPVPLSILQTLPEADIVLVDLKEIQDSSADFGRPSTLPTQGHDSWLFMSHLYRQTP